MTQLSFEEQDLIIYKLIEKYFKGKEEVIIEVHQGDTGDNPAGTYIDIKTNTACCIKDLRFYESDTNFDDDLAQALVEFIYEDDYKKFTIQDLQQKYFQDILTPSHNELIMFELTEGFEWPLAALCGYAVNYVHPLAAMQ